MKLLTNVCSRDTTYPNFKQRTALSICIKPLNKKAALLVGICRLLLTSFKSLYHFYLAQSAVSFHCKKISNVRSVFQRLIMVASLSSLLIQGCANYRPIIDDTYINPQQYERDLAECQSFADKVSPGKTLIVTSIIGAGIGAAVGLAAGVALNVQDKGSLVAFGASIGGIKGAVDGGVYSGLTQKQIICRCLSARGYNVLE